MGLEPLTTARGRALAAFFAGGGVLSLLAPLLPAGDATRAGAIAVVGAVALATAAVLAVVRWVLPTWLVHLLVLVGNVLIALVLVLAGPGEAGVPWAMMFVWSPVYAAAYLGRLAFAGHLASTVVLHAVALSTLDDVAAFATRLLLPAATALVVGAVVSSLVARIGRLAVTDALTGLPNRRTFDTALARTVAQARRRANPVAVAVLDLDGFKLLNDRHGHARGDELLREVARRWSTRLRRGDLLARVGGDEFALLLPDCTLEDALRVREQLIAVTPRAVGASVGVAALGPSDTAEDVVAAADAALYASKRGGGGAVTVPRPVPA